MSEPGRDAKLSGEVAAAVGDTSSDEPVTWRHRTRRFVKDRSRTQKVGGLVAVVLLLTAPFGGLKADPEPKPATLHLGKEIDLGPIDVKVQKVLSVRSLSETIKPQKKGGRLMVIEAVVRNHTDRPEVANQLSDAFYGRRLGIPVPGVRPTGSTYLVKDASLLTGGYLNPGLTYQVAITFEQQGDWVPGSGAQAPLLGLNRYVFRENSPGSLDDNTWILGRPLVEGPVTIEVKDAPGGSGGSGGAG